MFRPTASPLPPIASTAAATVDLCDAPADHASEAAVDACDDDTAVIAIVGEQAVLDEHVRAAGNELERELDKTIASTQAWRQNQQERFEAMRADAIAELTTSRDSDNVSQPAEEAIALPRCKPRSQRRSRAAAPWATTALEGNENADATGSPRPRAVGRLGPAVSLGEASATDGEANNAANRDDNATASPPAKALAAAVAARTEMLRQWEQEMEGLSRGLQQHLDVLARVQALDDGASGGGARARVIGSSDEQTRE